MIELHANRVPNVLLNYTGTSCFATISLVLYLANNEEYLE
jgi:hypothetical protein